MVRSNSCGVLYSVRDAAANGNEMSQVLSECNNAWFSETPHWMKMRCLGARRYFCECGFHPAKELIHSLESIRRYIDMAILDKMNGQLMIGLT